MILRMWKNNVLAQHRSLSHPRHFNETGLNHLKKDDEKSNDRIITTHLSNNISEVPLTFSRKNRIN